MSATKVGQLEVLPRTGVTWKFTGEELKKKFAARFAYYADKAKKYSELAAKVALVDSEEDLPEEIKGMYTNSGARSAKSQLEREARDAKENAKTFEVYAAHVDEKETFTLDITDIAHLELNK